MVAPIFPNIALMALTNIWILASLEPDTTIEDPLECNKSLAAFDKIWLSIEGKPSIT